jgi:hypothetical protein
VAYWYFTDGKLAYTSELTTIRLYVIAALGYDACALDLYGKGNRPTDCPPLGASRTFDQPLLTKLDGKQKRLDFKQPT